MNYKEIKYKTGEKFESMDFKPGDIFSEMLSYWKIIIGVEGDNLTIIQVSHNNLELKKLTKEEFKYKCQYKNIDGYWIDFMKNDSTRVSDYISTYIINRVGT